ncbi:MULTISPECIES: ABC transporter substrate-binding protein [Roseomonadaceae]|uniref:ABC transporter substrate-binding protein n=1 Tax=Roseomonadaceae TaxID=3385906 RepID=UPI001E4455F6|nr:ABC transporter substrate-binding protein [Roseomonas oleicola]
MIRRTALSLFALALWPGMTLAQQPLRVVAPFHVDSLEPSRDGFNFTRMGVAETLVGADDGGLPVPQLASGWTLSEDRLTWRMTLRAGAVFHDGTPVTAEAVAASLLRARAQPGPLANAPLTSIAADGPGVVELRTSTPFTPLLAFLAESSSQILAPASWDEAGAVRRLIATGPYRLAGFQPPFRFEVERFEGWNGGPPPAIARAVYESVARGETRALMAESGRADLVFTLDPAGTDRLRRSPRVEVRVMPIPRTQTLKLNAGLPFFADVRARQAVSLAIDREGIARGILRSPAAAATQLFPPTLAEWHVPGLASLRRDPAEARRLLAEAGWTPGAGGILAREGRPFRFTLRTFSTRPELPVVAASIQESLREVGIDMQVAVVVSSEIPAGHRDGTLEAGLMARNFSLVPDPIGTLLADFGPRGGDWGAMGWNSPELIEILAALGRSTDPAERAALRGRASTILQAELPVIPVVWYDHRVAISRRLANVSVDPLELSYRIETIRWAE